MGTYTQIGITATLTDPFTKIDPDEWREWVQARYDKEVWVGGVCNLRIVTDGETMLTCTLDSSRESNARWQAEEFFQWFREILGPKLRTFEAEMVQPETIISYNAEEQEEEDMQHE